MSVEKWILALFPIGAVYVDFFMPREHHKSAQAFVKARYDWLATLKFSDTGRTEAERCLAVFDRIFSPRLFSFNRYFSSGIACCVFISIYYALTEATRFFDHLPFRPPFSPIHYPTNFICDLVTGAIAFSLIRFLLVLSIRFGLAFNYSVLYFFVLMLVSAWLSEVYLAISIPVAMIIGQMFQAYKLYIIFKLGLAHSDHWGGLHWRHGFPVTFVNIFRSISNAEDLWFGGKPLQSLVHATTPIHLRWMKDLVEDGAYTDRATDMFWNYTSWTQLCFSLIRFVFWAVFFVSWILSTVHRFVKYLLWKFIESERGALTAMTAIAAAVASAISNIQ
jgi:hypothetical protein